MVKILIIIGPNYNGGISNFLCDVTSNFKTNLKLASILPWTGGVYY